MFLKPSAGVWMVGPNVGQDFGGILNRETGDCPESLTRDWEYYRWHVTRDDDPDTSVLELKSKSFDMVFCIFLLSGTGLTPGRRTGHWRWDVRTQDQHLILENPAPSAHSVMTASSGLRLMEWGTAVLRTVTLARWRWAPAMERSPATAIIELCQPIIKSLHLVSLQLRKFPHV